MTAGLERTALGRTEVMAAFLVRLAMLVSPDMHTKGDWSRRIRCVDSVTGTRGDAPKDTGDDMVIAAYRRIIDADRIGQVR